MTRRPPRVARLPLSDALRWSVGLSLLLTVLLFAVLSVRMAAGADPALGPKIVRQRSATQSRSQSEPSTTQVQPAQTATTAPTQTVAPVVTAPPVAPQALAPVQTSSS
jgi:hypothetical protein